MSVSQEPDTDAYPAVCTSHACAKPGHFSLGRSENSLDNGISKIAGSLARGITNGKEKREVL